MVLKAVSGALLVADGPACSRERSGGGGGVVSLGAANTADVAGALK